METVVREGIAVFELFRRLEIVGVEIESSRGFFGSFLHVRKNELVNVGHRRTSIQFEKRSVFSNLFSKIRLFRFGVRSRVETRKKSEKDLRKSPWHPLEITRRRKRRLHLHFSLTMDALYRTAYATATESPKPIPKKESPTDGDSFGLIAVLALVAFFAFWHAPSSSKTSERSE